MAYRCAVRHALQGRSNALGTYLSQPWAGVQLYLKLLQVVIAQRDILLELGVVLLQLRIVFLSLLMQLAEAAYLQQQQQLVCDATVRQQAALRLLCKHSMCPICHMHVSQQEKQKMSLLPTHRFVPTQAAEQRHRQKQQKTILCPYRARKGRNLSVGFAAFLCYAHAHRHATAAELKESITISCNTLRHLCGIFTNLFLGFGLLILQLAHEGC